ncbi:non-ribosomal peptide synthetase [Actinomadura chibensis]|uniref:Non-ribosomal peptide synthetase n=1 Tax=Actinomadura chibensis TaxID=392828 RepID=A0A5D0NEY1_9ACTN|nr:non-ribosomal peptide synthetase [Actinomadura chibensis]TYB42785.1 non-ribosomal peptide synthetase [Actinomadura chibensis]
MSGDDRPESWPLAWPVSDRDALVTVTRRLGDRRLPADPRPAVMAAFLAVARKYAGADGFALDVLGRGRVGFTMPPDLTLAAHVRAVAAALAAPARGGGTARTAFAPRPPSGDDGHDLVVSVADDGNGLALRLDGRPPAYTGEPAERLLQHVLTALDRILAAPGSTLAELELTGPHERALVVDGFNDTRRDYPRNASITELFAEQAAARPEAPAVVHADGTLTYRDLDDRSARLAATLRERGVRRHDRVALISGKTPDLVVGTLAILRAGGVYVPIDHDVPPERRDLLLRDSGARVLVTGEPIGPAPAGTAVVHPGDLAASAAPDREGAATDGAYVMYTSGTTGVPKGVLVNQRAVVRLVRGTDFARLGPGTRILQTGAIGFDATTFELWGTLLTGGALVLVPEDAILDAARLGDAFAAYGVTTLWLTAPLFHQLIDQDATVFRRVREVLAGGDALSPEHIARVLDACPGLRVVNGYGPTENTTFSTTHAITAPPTGRIPIGAPIANSTAYVVDLDGLPQPIGVPGELLVGGDGLADGYLDRPELDAAAFIPDRFGAGGRLYRTGDLASRRPDGTLDFLGRRDDQVKIRGFRVEPGEVEHRLARLPRVRSAAVLVRVRPGGREKYLCACYTSDGAPNPDELRRALRAELPDHLVPARFVRVEAMPLTRNGKIDRAALAALADAAPEERPAKVAPRDEIERALADLWRDALGLPSIGVTDDLLDLGVTSLTAAAFAARTRRGPGPRLSAAEVLTNPTIERQARTVRERGGTGDGPPPLTRAAEAALYPVTPQQRGIYVEQVKNQDATHYNVPVRVEVPGRVDVDRLQKAVEGLVARHDCLRTTFVQAGSATYQRVSDDVRVRVELVSEGAVLVRPFDLGEGPLLRVFVQRGADADTVTLDLHHIVADGVTIGILLDELDALYDGRPLPEPAFQYKDYAVWLADGASDWIRERQAPYWREVLGEPPERSDLPTDFDRPAVRSLNGDRLEFTFGAARTAALKELAHRAGATPFAALTAVYLLFLAQITGDDDVTVGTPAAARTFAGTERVTGMVATTLCVRAAIDPERPFTAFLDDVRRRVLGALAHQDVPFEAPGGDPARHPLFDTMVGLQDAAAFTGRPVLGGRARPADTLNRCTMFDLNLQVYDRGGVFDAVWAYGTDLFRPGTVRAFADRLLGLADAAAAAPERTVGDLVGRRSAAPAPGIGFDFDFPRPEHASTTSGWNGS